MTDPQGQHTPGNIPEGPPVKRPCMNETPPIALTPADDGSDFYNTPWTAATPVYSDQKGGNNSQTPTTEPSISSNPPSLIPGLSLVNDSLKEQAEQNESSARENSENKDKPEIGAQNSVTPGQPEKKEQGTEESNLQKSDAMDVDQENGQNREEAALDKTSGERASKDGIANKTSGVSDAEVTQSVQAEQQQQEGEEEEEEHPEWELDSSPYESSSDSSTDSSDDSDEEEEDYPILSPEEQARILMQGELGSDDEGEGKGKSSAPLKTANEIAEEVLPIPGITITPEMKIVLLGNVEAVVENTILISANVSGVYQVLEAGSLLCLEDRRIAGVVSETLGRVENPLYAVRFATAAEVEERGLSRGTAVYYVEQHSTFVFTQPLKGMKGSDASNFHDEEVAEDEVEFSDDEKEAEYKRRLKQKRQERKGARNENADPTRAKKGPPGPSKLSQSELNYDDNAVEDGYTPLARPKNLHEMMGQEVPVERESFSNRSSGFGGGRGRGRGTDRGRGGRGRGGQSRDYREHYSHNDRQSHYQRERSDVQPQPLHYPPYNPSQQYPSYPQQQPQQQQQPYAQAAMPTPFNFQLPYQQAYQQMPAYPQMASNPHINPLFIAALQQQQQQQQQQPQYQQPQQPVPGQQQGQNQAMNFDQVKAQLDLLRQLSNGNQWPPRS